MILQDRSILAVCKRAGTSIAQTCDVVLIPAEVFFFACTVLVATVWMVYYLTELIRILRDLSKSIVPAKRPRRSACRKVFIKSGDTRGLFRCASVVLQSRWNFKFDVIVGRWFYPVEWNRWTRRRWWIYFHADISLCLRRSFIFSFRQFAMLSTVVYANIASDCTTYSTSVCAIYNVKS